MAIAQVTAVIHGQTYTLTYNSTTRRYEAVVPVLETSHHQPGGYFNASVTATNDSGVSASTDGGNLPGLRLVTREITTPTIALLSPAAGFVTNNRPMVTLDLLDEAGGSGIDLATLSIAIDGLPGGITTQAITGGYRASWTPTNPLSEGRHSLTVSVQDYDGNRASFSAQYVVDTVPPELYVDGYRQIVDADSILVSGTVRDVTSPPVVLTVGGVTVPTDSYGHFETMVPLAIGENHIPVIVTDQAGLSSTKSLYAIRLITDRTRADVDRLLYSMAAQTMSPEPNHRGAYNYTDLNRVTIAAAFLAGELLRRGYLNPYQPIYPAPDRTEWLPSDIPTLTQMQTYADNISRTHKTLASEAPTPPRDLQRLTYQGANDMERVLVCVEAVFPWLDKSYVMAGEAMCGEF